MSDIAQRMALDIAKEVPSVYAGGRLERAIDHALQKRLAAHDQEIRVRDREYALLGQTALDLEAQS
jgi:hypothetical protein